MFSFPCVSFLPSLPKQPFAGRRVTRNKGLSVRQYYELVGDTFDLRSKWEKAITAAGLDAVGSCFTHLASCSRAGFGSGCKPELARLFALAHLYATLLGSPFPTRLCCCCCCWFSKVAPRRRPCVMQNRHPVSCSRCSAPSLRNKDCTTPI